MRKIILAAVFLVSTGTGVSWADGVERRAVTPPPAPLTTQPYTAPTPHFGGTVVDTAQCMTASGDVVKCEGAYVIHGSVIRSETMTPHYESVDPIIHEQGNWTGSSATLAGSAQPVMRKPHGQNRPQQHVCSGHCEGQAMHVEKDTRYATFSGDYQGGVGYNVPTQYLGGARAIVVTGATRGGYGGGYRSGFGGCR